MASTWNGRCRGSWILVYDPWLVGSYDHNCGYDPWVVVGSHGIEESTCIDDVGRVTWGKLYVGGWVGMADCLLPRPNWWSSSRRGNKWLRSWGCMGRERLGCWSVVSFLHEMGWLTTGRRWNAEREFKLDEPNSSREGCFGGLFVYPDRVPSTGTGFNGRYRIRCIGSSGSTGPSSIVDINESIEKLGRGFEAGAIFVTWPEIWRNSACIASCHVNHVIYLDSRNLFLKRKEW